MGNACVAGLAGNNFPFPEAAPEADGTEEKRSDTIENKLGCQFSPQKVRRPSKKSSLIFIRLLPRSWQETEESENFFKTVWLDMWQRKARRKLFLLLSLQSAKSLFQIQKSSGLFFP